MESGKEMCAKYIMLIHIPPGTEKMCAKYIFIPLPAVFRVHIALSIGAFSVHKTSNRLHICPYQSHITPVNHIRCSNRPYVPETEIPLSRRQTKSEFCHKLHKEKRVTHVGICATYDKNDGVLSA